MRFIVTIIMRFLIFIRFKVFHSVASEGDNVYQGATFANSGVPYVDSSGTISTDTGLTYNAATDTLTSGAIDAPTGRTASYVIAASTGYASVAEEALWKAQADVTVDGTADDVEIQAALTAGYSDILLSPGTFVMSAGSGTTPVLRITTDGQVLRGSGWNTVLDFTAHTSSFAIVVGQATSIGTPTLCTANVSSLNNRTIAVTDATGITSGDVIKLYSNDTWLTTIGLLGELCEVDTVVGNTITTKSTIYGNTTNSATAYTTANSAAVVKVNPVKNAQIGDLKVLGNAANTDTPGIYVSYSVDTTIDNCFVQDFPRKGVVAAHSLRGVVNKSRFEGINMAGLGYAFMMGYSSRDWFVNNCHFTNVRHATDVGGSSVEPGIPRNMTVQGCYAEDTIAACYSSHSLGDFVTYIGNTAISPGDIGITISVLHGHASSNKVENFSGSNNVGIQVLGTDWGSEKGGVVIDSNIINGYGLKSIATTGANNVTITSNTCNAGRSTSGRIQISTSDYITISNNSSNGANGNGAPFIEVLNSSFIDIGNNNFNGSASYVAPAVYVKSSTETMSNINISDNTFTSCGGSSSACIKVEETGGFAISHVAINNNLLSSSIANSYALILSKTGNYYQVKDNDVQDVTKTDKVSLTGINSTDVIEGNIGYITSGEIRTVSGSLTAGTVGNAVIAWQNPNLQALMVSGTTRITTGATAASVGDWGLATTVAVLEDCEDVWNEVHASTVTLTDTTGTLTESGAALNTGANELHITGAGTFTFALPSGYTATVANGTATLDYEGAVSDTLVVDSGATTGTITVTVTSVVTNAVNTTYVERGTNCLAFTVPATVDTNDIIGTEARAAVDISTATHITLKLRATTTTVAGDYQLLIDEDAGCASPSYSLNLPVLTANTTQLVVLNINAGAAAGATADAIISIGLKYTKATSVANTIYIDDIRAVTVGTDLINDANLQTLGQAAYGTTAPVHVDYKNNDDATHHDTVIMVSATNDSTGLVGSYYVNGQGE